MYNPRESLKTAATIGVAGLGIATLGFGGLGAVLLGGAAAGAGAAGLSSLIDPERPYQVERKERQRKLTPEEKDAEKKRCGEIADRYIANIESFFRGAKTVGKFSLEAGKYAGEGIKSVGKRISKGADYAKDWDEYDNLETSNINAEYEAWFRKNSVQNPKGSQKIPAFMKVSRPSNYEFSESEEPDTQEGYFLSEDFVQKKWNQVAEKLDQLESRLTTEGQASSGESTGCDYNESRTKHERPSASGNMSRNYEHLPIRDKEKSPSSVRKRIECVMEGLTDAVVGAGVYGTKAAARVEKYAVEKGRRLKNWHRTRNAQKAEVVANDDSKETGKSFMYRTGKKTNEMMNSAADKGDKLFEKFDQYMEKHVGGKLDKIATFYETPHAERERARQARQDQWVKEWQKRIKETAYRSGFDFGKKEGFSSIPLRSTKNQTPAFTSGYEDGHSEGIREKGRKNLVEHLD